MDRIRLSKNIILDCFNTSLIIHNKNPTVVLLDNLEFQVLRYLVDRKDTVVSKDELLSLWPSKVVMDHSLARVMSILRKKLGDSPKKPIFIKTLNRQGYVYIGLSCTKDTLMKQGMPFVNLSKQSVIILGICASCCLLFFYILG